MILQGEHTEGPQDALDHPSTTDPRGPRRLEVDPELDLDDGAGPGPDWSRLEVRVLLALGLSEFEQSGMSSAQDIVSSAITLARAIDDRELEALARSQHAMLLGRSGQLPESLVQVDLAMRHLDTLAPRDQWVVLLNRGMARSELHDLAGARSDFVRARDVAREHGLTPQEFMATHNLGYAAYLAGDMPEALSRMAEADRIGTDVSRAAARLDAGRVLLEAGLVSEAAETLSEAVQLCGDRHQEQIRGEAELELSRALTLQGHLGGAGRAADAARRRFTRRGTPLWAERAQLERLQIQLARGHRPATVEADAVAMASRAAATQDAILTAHASLLAAEAALAANRPESAASHAETASWLRRTGSLSTRLRLSLVEAHGARSAGDPVRASRILRDAARDLRISQGASASLDLRSARSLHGVALADLDIDLALGMGATTVLTTTERWRNAAAALPVITTPADPALAGLLTELRGMQERLRDETLPREAASRLREEFGLVQRRIRLRDWAAGGRAVPAAVAMPTIAQSRDDLVARDTDLVSYLGHHGQLLAVTLVRGRARLIDIGSLTQVGEQVLRVQIDLQALAQHGHGPMGVAIRASLTRQLQDLDRVLLGGLPRGRRLLVVPTRELTLLPWGMLPSRRGTPTTTAASARGWSRRPHVASAAPAVAVVAGPGLQQAAAEAREVSAVWGVAPVAPEDSSTSGLRDALAFGDIVHVAAHGRHEQESPLFSSLRLADGSMFAHELTESGVSAAHVVLSACDVGRSTVRPGDEPLGLSAALIHLGASSVVAPLCRIPDDVAALTMVAYHRALRTGVDAGDALASATEGAELLAAAFTVTGSPFRVSRPSG